MNQTYTCFGTKPSVTTEPEEDMVGTAFKRMDRNMDGFLTWEEFKRVTYLYYNLAMRNGRKYYKFDILNNYKTILHLIT